MSGLEPNSILLAQQDSTNLSLSELKLTLKLLNELEYRRAKDGLFTEKESFYKDLIKDYNENEELYEKQLANKNAEIEAVTPAWYDNFWTGSAITAIIISSIFFLAR